MTRIGLFFLAFLIIPNLSHAEAERTSLRLGGAIPREFAAATDGSRFYVACERSPYGIFFTDTFGGTWTVGTGGDYEAGEGRSVDANITDVYMATSDAVYTAKHSGPAVWTMLDIEGLVGPRVVKVAGEYLLIGTSEGKIIVYNIGSKSVIASSSVSVKSVSDMAYSSFTGYLYAEIDTDNLTKQFYRAQFNSTTGALGEWTSITSNIGIVSTKFDGLATDSSGRVYISTFNAGAEDGVYRSSNNGDSFTRILIASNAGDASFVGSTYIVGSFISNDSGETWVSLPQQTTETNPLHLSSNAVLINPVNGSQAYRGADVGVGKTANLSDLTTSTWVEANDGLEGTTVIDMAQLSTLKDRVLVATNTAFAFTENFTAEVPEWEYPILPLGDGAGSTAVAINPDDEDMVFASTSRLYKGIIDDSVTPSTIAWSVIDDPATTESGFSFLQIRDLDIPVSAPTKLVAVYKKVEDGINGMLRIYDISSDFAETTIAALIGRPLEAVYVVNDNLAFVSVDYPRGDPSDSQSGVYRCLSSCLTSSSTWTQMTDSDLPSALHVTEFAYSSTSNILYAAAADGVYILADVTSGEVNWSKAVTGLPENAGRGYTAVAIDTAGDQSVYVSTEQFIYRSKDSGATWDLLYTGLRDEATYELFFDALVQGSNAGFYALEEQGLGSPVYVLWNGFLSMTNILELVNKGTSDLDVTLKLYAANGELRSSTNISISPSGQRDVVLNTLSGFAEGAYGLVELVYTGTDLDGRLFHYRSEDGFNTYDYAYGVPLSPSLTGDTYVAFNTYNPSLSQADSGDTVLNWLSLVNLADTEKDFEVIKYSLYGEELFTTSVTVPAHGRRDLEGGHGLGASQVGFNAVRPLDASAPYKAELVRYGARPDGGYSYAFPLLPSAGLNDLWVGISSGAGAQNWLELQNVLNSAQEIMLTSYDNTGQVVDTRNLSLGGHQGIHIDASAFLSSGMSGAVNAKVSGNGPALIAQSMFYFRSSSGSIQAFYGNQGTGSLGSSKWGTWNLFLNMYNWLRVFNTGNTPVDVTVQVYNGNNPANERVINLDAHSGIDLGLHETSTYGTNANNYGPVHVQGTGVLTELLRIRPNADGSIDFAAPTVVR